MIVVPHRRKQLLVGWSREAGIDVARCLREHAMADFVKKHSLRLLVAFACPVLAIVGVFFVTAGELMALAPVARVGESLVSLSAFFMLPMGVFCLLLSWHQAHRNNEPKRDSEALIEFLLGFGGAVMFVIGAVFTPLWQWIADHF